MSTILSGLELLRTCQVGAFDHLTTQLLPRSVGSPTLKSDIASNGNFEQLRQAY